MIEKFIEQIETFDEKSVTAFGEFIKKINNTQYIKAAELILEAEKNKNRVHITGIGKPSHVATYGASLLSSTGTPTYFLHATEAVHGSLGQLISGDVVIAISNSGETIELKQTIEALKKNGCKVISISGGEDSWLKKEGDAYIYAGVSEEGDRLNRAPRSSILAEVYVVARLSLFLQEYKEITPKKYVKWHPGGALGSLRENEK